MVAMDLALDAEEEDMADVGEGLAALGITLILKHGAVEVEVDMVQMEDIRLVLFIKAEVVEEDMEVREQTELLIKVEEGEDMEH
jgi:hypothetical protein